MKNDSDASASQQPLSRGSKLALAIRRARGDMGQVRFAAVIGRVQSVVSQWENGRSMPSIEALAITEERLGLPLGTLAAEAGYVSPEAVRAVESRNATMAHRWSSSLSEALRLNRPGFDGGSGYWFPTPAGSACWAA